MVTIAKLDLLQGTLGTMVMRTLNAGPANGYEMAKAIERMSDDVLQVDPGSVYPALHCSEKAECLSANGKFPRRIAARASTV
jgi:PadR family transcriptional regulator, regulatory protein PadR